MSYRKFEMYQYRQILHLMRQGQSDRLIAKTNLAGRPKCRVIRTIAVQQGWLNSEHPLPDDKAQCYRRRVLPPHDLLRNKL